jgi:hypothetical protein
MSELVIKDIPTPILLFMFVSGFFIFLLTPIWLIFPAWIYPFSNVIETSSDALSSIFIIVIMSFILGILPLLFRKWIIGNCCWVAWLKGVKTSDKPFSADYINVDSKIQSNMSARKRIAFLSTKYHIVNGALAGSEIAVLTNIITCVVLDSVVIFHLLAVSPSYLTTTVFYLLLSTSIGFIIWYYERRWFKPSYEIDTITLMKYIEEPKPTKSKIPYSS